MIKVPIYIEEVEGYNKSIVIMEAESIQDALVKAAQRIADEYSDDNTHYSVSKVQDTWSAWPCVYVTHIVNGKVTNAELLRVCSVWDTISDVKLRTR